MKVAPKVTGQEGQGGGEIPQQGPSDNLFCRYCGQPTGHANPDPGYSDRFAPGSKVWVAVYLRDQSPQTPVEFKVVRPDGETFASWTSGAISQVYPFTYWYGQIDLPVSGHQGRWKVQVSLEGKITEHAFAIGGLPSPTTVATSVTPLVAATTPGTAANFDIVVRNTGTTTAVNCSIAPDTPLAAVWNFQVLIGGVPQGTVNQLFDVNAGTAARLRLSINPKIRHRASKVQIPVAAICSNGSEAASQRAKVITVSF